MTLLFGSTADSSAPPKVDVRNHLGDLVVRTHFDKADELARRGLAEWVGRGNRRYVRLAESAPTLPTGWRGGSRTTERIRNDAGVIVGAPKSGLQHRT